MILQLQTWRQPGKLLCRDAFALIHQLRKGYQGNAKPVFLQHQKTFPGILRPVGAYMRESVFLHAFYGFPDTDSDDYTDSFSLISGILESCDFTVANLETILSESNPYSTAERLVNEQPNCNAPADYLGPPQSGLPPPACRSSQSAGKAAVP